MKTSILSAIILLNFVNFTFAAESMSNASENNPDEFLSIAEKTLVISSKTTETSSSNVEQITKDFEDRLNIKDIKKLKTSEQSTPITSKKIHIRRDYNGIRSAGRYFTGKAYINIPTENEEDDVKNVEIPFTEDHQKKLNDMGNFLSEMEPQWLRNHLSTDLFAVVFDTRSDQVKIIDGTLQTRKELDPDNEYTFAIRSNNRLIQGYKFADFVSSKVEKPNNNQYEFIDVSALRPITDQDKHGDRQALDTIKTNPHLFFNLIRREGNIEDLKILGMGIRYSSSYDACQDCFERLYNSRSLFNSTLYAIAKTQGYMMHESIDNLNSIPVYNMFYSTRPYYKKEGTTKNITAYWGEASSKKELFNTNIAYTFENKEPIYYLDFKDYFIHNLTNKESLDVLDKSISIPKDVILHQNVIYHNCQVLNPPKKIHIKITLSSEHKQA